MIGNFEVMELFGLINTDEFGSKSYSDEAISFTTEILSTINAVKDNFECDFSFNVEMIPAENCAGVVCQADNLLYNTADIIPLSNYSFYLDGELHTVRDYDLISANVGGKQKNVFVKDAIAQDYEVVFADHSFKFSTLDKVIKRSNKSVEYYIYSNQWIPLKERCSIQEKCKLGSLFDSMCGGGCIAHINIENRFPNEEVAWEMLNYVASMGVIYFAFTTKINVDEDRHAFIGTSHCPKCGKPVADVWARVVGYYIPVSNYQKVRRREFEERKWYNALEKESWM